MKKTKDPVNQVLIDQVEKLGLDKLGATYSYVWRDDPKRLVFSLSRYKFVSKILEGKKNNRVILEKTNEYLIFF